MLLTLCQLPVLLVCCLGAALASVPSHSDACQGVQGSDACQGVQQSLLQRGTTASQTEGTATQSKELASSSLRSASDVDRQTPELLRKVQFDAGNLGPDPGDLDAEAAGLGTVTSNDLAGFTSSLIVNTVVLCIHITLFVLLRSSYPKIFSNAWLSGRAPFSPGEGLFTWVWVSWRLTPQEIIASAGLDAAMVIKFQDLCINFLTLVGMPMFLIIAPMNWLGGGATEIDPLSKLDIVNLTDGSWLYWVHAIIVWIVTVTLQKMILAAQHEFLELRYEWLRTMPHPRATTCLVQNIPKEFRTDAKLKWFVNNMLMRDVVDSAYIIRRTPEELRSKIDSLKQNKEKAKAALRKGQRSGEAALTPRGEDQQEVDSVEHYNQLVKSDTEAVQVLRASIAKAADAGDESVCAEDGFVTFKNVHDAELALSMRARTSADEAAFSSPPDPTDVRYDVLEQGGLGQTRRTWLGSLLILCLFFSYLPIVVAISLVTNLHTLRHVLPIINTVVMTYPMATSLWDGIVGSFVLAMVISFVPTFMLIIIRGFFGLAAETWCQHRLQNWYFYFQIVFVLLIFCVGNSLFSTYLKLVKNPTRLFSLLASTLPGTAHFYLNFFPLQWAVHASQICRYVNLLKFWWYSKSIDEDEARALSEPEDQDYYGMGARSARFSLLFVIALVFSSVCPAIGVLALVDFLICRVIFAYLLVFAEGKKADTGGQFWCTQLQHLQLGLFLYITLMVGILIEKSGAYGPGIIASTAYIYMMDSHLRLERKFGWIRLPFEEIVAMQSSDAKVLSDGCYMQPALISET